MALWTLTKCGVWHGALVVGLLAAGTCNSPYPAADERANALYTSFADEPVHMDPAQAYGGLAYSLICHIVEPPLQYHLLKRPYALEPLTATEVPRAETRRITWEGKGMDAVVYTVRLKRGILYQDHPCFVAANRRLTEREARGIRRLADFRQRATRELVASDYVLGIRRLADPRLTCPVIGTLQQNILGFADYGAALSHALEAARAERRQAAGPLYNREEDEKYNPIRLDYAAYPLPGVREVDRHTFEIVLQQPYPQLLYWMTMPFFAPVPPEALEFFGQRPLLERALTFDKTAIGTGPFVLAEYDPTNQMVLERNPNFRDERYPSLADPDRADPRAVAYYEELKAAGMLDDAGRRLPMVDRVVFRREREWIPRWAKFRQGYYDDSGISSDLFDQAITLTSSGDATLSDDMVRQGIRLFSAPSMVVNYFAFNMRDPVVGGLGDRPRKLRQAISIAFNTEEEIAIFRNGRGVVAHTLIPPGIFGHEEGPEGINPITHRWDPERACAVRRPLDAARQLLKEAGYENGYGPDGRKLVLNFDTGWVGSELRPRLKFVAKQFDKLGIHLNVRTTDQNRFEEKVIAGNFQILSWGWMADYPDPENFFFLLYGPNAKVGSAGENSANYANPEYDRLFGRMRNMENGPERLALIRQMSRILQEDAPWFGCVHPVSFTLVHEWHRNAYPNALAWGELKYRRIEAELRAERRRAWNRPRWEPVALVFALLVLGTVPAVRIVLRHLSEA